MQRVSLFPGIGGVCCVRHSAVRWWESRVMQILFRWCIIKKCWLLKALSKC